MDGKTARAIELRTTRETSAKVDVLAEKIDALIARYDDFGPKLDALLAEVAAQKLASPPQNRRDR
jgi:hypothetical protein